jgi:hypothetical protein
MRRLLTFVAPAFPFSVVNPKTGECRQILVPGRDTFPGNWEVVSTPAAGPGPWNGHGHGCLDDVDHAKLSLVQCH